MEEKQASLAVVELVKRLDSVIQARGAEGDGPGQREEQTEIRGRARGKPR